MARVPTHQDFRAFMRENAEMLAGSLIDSGIFDYDANFKQYEPVENPDTLSAIRTYFVDFFENDCRRRTYLLDPNEAVGLPSWRYHSFCYERCYMSLFVAPNGLLNWKFTWTSGELAIPDEITRIDLTFRRALSGWAHASTAGSSVKLWGHAQ